jgi:hypothetical protein
MTFADTPDGPRVETTHWTDLVFIQDLLVAGTPDAREPGRSRTLPAITDPDLAAYVERFADEVRSGRYDDDAAAAARAWHDGLAELEARGVDDHHDTVVRDQIGDLLQEPLAAAGIDPEELLSFG